MEKILENLNEAQKLAITHKTGPLLIIAGAGTGKTTVLTRRIAWLIGRKLAKPEEILAMTFTDKAAAEMKDRVDQLLPLSYGDLEISTFHAFAKKILTDWGLDIGLPNDFKLLTDIDLWILVKNHLHDFNLGYYKPIGNPSKFIYALIKHFQKAKGEGITPQDYLDYAQELVLAKDEVSLGKKSKKKSSKKVKDQSDDQEVARINEIANAFHVYQKLLLDSGSLDFGDLINYSLQLFRTRPKILDVYQKQFKYVLIDEFQDTDLAQYELIKLIAQGQKNITVVGDDDQSIYKFRGASISNILKFEEDYPNCTKITLTQNYRSTQDILDLSYYFIQKNNPERLETKLNISKKLLAKNSSQGKIEVIHAKDVYQETSEVVSKIKTLVQEGQSLNEIAILVRANDHAEIFINELSRNNIPYIYWANRGLYKKPIILDLLAYFNLLDERHESANLLRVLNFKKFFIPDEEIIKINFTAKIKALSIFEVLKDLRVLIKLPESSYKVIDDFLANLSKHTTLARGVSVTELFVKVLRETEIIKDILADSAENFEKRNLIEQFYRLTQNFEKKSEDKSLKAFLTELKMEQDAGFDGALSFDPSVGPEAVKVMTIHTAKGLEFETVFVVNVVDQRIPSRERKDPIEIPMALIKEILPEGDAHLMEERRLFYVAMTRAKKNLILTWAENYGGSTQSRKPSKFLIELGLEKTPEKKQPIGEVFFPKIDTQISQKIQYHLPNTFSFTQISTFLHCPLEYKYKYLYHLPSVGAANLSFGQTIHKTLELFTSEYKQLNSIVQNDLFGSHNNALDKKIPSFEDLLKFYKEYWVDDWYEDKDQKEEFRKRGKQLLNNFYQEFIRVKPNLKFIEKQFSISLNDYKFVGKIDRIDENSDKSINIIDYKTGKPKTKLDPVDKEQLLIYQLAASECLQESVKNLKYYYLEAPDSAIEFLGKNEDLIQLKGKLLTIIDSIINTIKTNDFLQIDISSKPHNCEYKILEN